MTDRLKKQASFDSPDDVYQLIIDMHKGLSDEESQLVNAKMIVLLANHIGDAAIIAEAAQLARDNTLSRHAKETV
ncbi:hypothetical protein GCM10017044_10700 [Kordiimonas sediminis]|uniref:DUF2783 domain-containing protein n=1 Tax=Kordiimonas sediminis TaxID=1735581 RepID=A0A919APL4_9PROT|nr:DUF2783 domain-containing protein [Kordiimonas sediminis]GHF18054.1 hypothetical protein GCM10017044_10700 [Kordiimonas sediminis]